MIFLEFKNLRLQREISLHSFITANTFSTSKSENRQLLSYSLVCIKPSKSKYCNYPQYWDSQASANSVDPDQMAPSGAVRSGSTLFVI